MSMLYEESCKQTLTHHNVKELSVMTYPMDPSYFTLIWHNLAAVYSLLYASLTLLQHHMYFELVLRIS